MHTRSTFDVAVFAKATLYFYKVFFEIPQFAIKHAHRTTQRLSQVLRMPVLLHDNWKARNMPPHNAHHLKRTQTLGKVAHVVVVFSKYEIEKENSRLALHI